MVVGRLIEVLEDEGFFVHLLNRRDALYQVCRDATVASLRREGTNVVVDCAASDRSFFHAALIEVLAGIERNLREIRQPLVAADLQRSALSERPPAATPGARLRDYLAVDALRPRLLAEDKDGVIAELVDLLDEQGAVRDRQAALRAVMDREEGLSTGLQHGLALPHGRTDAVTRLVCAVGLKPEGVEFGSLDERPARIVVLALAPAGAAAPQIQFISLISQVLDEKGRAALLACDTPEDMYAVLTGLSPAGAAARRTRPAGALDCLQWHNIALDLSARTKEEVIDQLLALCARSGGVVSLAEARQAICQREARASTAIEYGIALPHAVTEAVDRLVCAVGISRPGVAFGAADGAPSRLFIMTLLPPSVTTAYTHLTGAILRALGPEGREALFAARSGQEALAVLKRGETGGGRSG
jgi:mannitol/fructose-specific phosphotransferase system IIA component (Ntr-type)